MSSHSPPGLSPAVFPESPGRTAGNWERGCAMRDLTQHLTDERRQLRSTCHPNQPNWRTGFTGPRWGCQGMEGSRQGLPTHMLHRSVPLPPPFEANPGRTPRRKCLSVLVVTPCPSSGIIKLYVDHQGIHNPSFVPLRFRFQRPETPASCSPWVFCRISTNFT